MLSQAERKKLLSAYEDVRVADVRDGLDTILLHEVGSMDQSIRPLWRTRVHGIAKTVRLVPWDGRVPQLSPAEYWQWCWDYYHEICPYHWVDELKEGDILVVDQSGVDAGLFGSENALKILRMGGRGVVTNGGVRDTDEIILQKVPFFLKSISQKMVQGRLMYDAHDVPVSVGGVTVRSGDIIVADNDGVIAVPRERADEVAGHAHREHERDKVDRINHYQALGRAVDETVRPNIEYSDAAPSTPAEASDE